MRGTLAGGETCAKSVLAASAGGAFKVLLKTGAEGKGKAKLLAKGLKMSLPAPGVSTYFQRDTEVIVQLVNESGACWSSEFVAADTPVNVPVSFKAQTR